MLAQQPFCFSAKGTLEHDSHNQCAKHCSHRLQPGICGPKLFSPASKRNTNKQHKQQNNDDNVGSAVAFMSFDFGPYLSKRTGSDTRKGMNWLYTAAVNGSHYAMYRLAKECLKGEHIQKDTARAVEWFAKSAEGGNPYAQYMLGKLYLTGTEAPYDEERAIHWLTRSAEQGNQYAQYLLNHLEENRPPSAMLAVTRLLHHMSRVFRDNSVPKSRPGGIQIDRKRLKKLQEKRIAMGHKPDDHEEQWSNLTM